jgi:hypothetical protein
MKNTWTPKYALPEVLQFGRWCYAPALREREAEIERAKALYERVCAELDSLEVQARP